MDQDEINDREWRDESNWTRSLLPRYASERDTRVWVPKRNPAMGWTLNFARPASLFWLALVVLSIPLALMLIPVWATRHLHR